MSEDLGFFGAHLSPGTAFHVRRVSAHGAALPRLQVEALGKGPLRRQGVQRNVLLFVFLRLNKTGFMFSRFLPE
jgi:hypothetical protein